jgi:ketosteroid isomerase-like protein
MDVHPSVPEARELLERGMACVNTRDIDRMLDLVHPDARWLAPTGATSADAYEGREGVRQFINEWLEAWEGFHQELLDLNCEGDRVLARVRIRARGETSGVEFDADVGYIVEIADGTLKTFELYTNYDEAVAAF